MAHGHKIARAVVIALLAVPRGAVAGPDDRKAEALAHFEQGNALFKSGVVAAALAEFLESRKLYPTKSATSNAALCLARLDRYDEALDLYTSLLNDFPDLPEDLKTQAQREVVRLRGLVGTIEVEGAEPGAAIVVDGRDRGERSMSDPGVMDERLRLRGLVVGTWIGWSIFNPVPIHFRLGEGFLVGSVEDARAGRFAPNGRTLVLNGNECVGENTTATPVDVPCFHVGTVVESHSHWSFYVAPEVRVGLPIGRHVEVNLGVALPVLLSVSPVRWGTSPPDKSPHVVSAGPDGAGQFPTETLVSSSLVLFAPGVGARYEF